MNQFQSISSGEGILKNDYGDDQKTPLAIALKRRRDKLKDTKLGIDPNDEEIIRDQLPLP
jgi:hypothetical protein